MKKMFFGFLAVAALLLLSGCALQSSFANNRSTQVNVLSGTVKVEIKGMAFVPSEVMIKKGSTVEWTNLDDVPHTVTSSQNFDSGTITKGKSWSHTFDSAGTFDYICTIHTFMKGKITVAE